MAGRAASRYRGVGDGAGELPDSATFRLDFHPRRQRPRRHSYHPLSQHHPSARRRSTPRRPVHGTPHPRHRSLERPGDGHARQHARRQHRRSYLHFRQRGDLVRNRLQLLFSRSDRRSRGRSDLLPGSFLARHLCAFLSGRADNRRTARQFSPGSRRQWPVLLSPSLADARLLAVSDGVHGGSARSRPSIRPIS